MGTNGGDCYKIFFYRRDVVEESNFPKKYGEESDGWKQHMHNYRNCCCEDDPDDLQTRHNNEAEQMQEWMVARKLLEKYHTM
jgi:hypothetical protein